MDGETRDGAIQGSAIDRREEPPDPRHAETFRVDALKKGVGSVDIVKGIKYLFGSADEKPEGTVFANGH